MLSAHDVVQELRRRLPDAGDMKIHKLAYYCQGWHVTWLGKPIFEEPIEAWDQGPVVADLWHDEKRDRPRPATQNLGDEQLAVINYVVDRYGHHSGSTLKRMTHLEDPWREVTEADHSFTVANPEITHDRLAAWFRSDDDFESHHAEVRRLRERRDIYGFDGPAINDDLREATLRVLREHA